MEADLDVPTGPVESQFGYHVILVRDRTEPVLDDYRADIVASLRSQAQQSLLGDWMLEVVGAAEVTVEEEYGTWESEPFPSVVPPAQ